MNGLPVPLGAALPAVDWTRVALAAGVAVAVLLVLWLARSAARHRYAKLAATEVTELLEVPMKVASRTALPFMLAVSALAGLVAADFHGRGMSASWSVATIALFWQAGLWVSTAVMAWLDHRRSLMLTEDKAAAGSIGVIRFVARAAIWMLVLLLTLENLGVDVTALIAGLGIGGIAVALALQNVLGDLLASLSITLDRPFVVGDFVIVGEHMGTVEFIGIKSTRLRSLTGEQIVMSNSDLLASRLHNYGRMQERRVVFTLGVTYETSRARLAGIPALLRKVVEAQEGVRFDRAHFATHGPHSLDFEIVYYVLSPDYGRYMDVQQSINFRIHEAFEDLGVQFAYPTQTLWLANGASVTSPAQGVAA